MLTPSLSFEAFKLLLIMTEPAAPSILPIHRAEDLAQLSTTELRHAWMELREKELLAPSMPWIQGLTI